MRFGKTDPVGYLNRVLDAVAAQQQVSMHNMANARTPGYTAKAMPFEQVLRESGNPFETQLSLKMGHRSGVANDTGKPVEMVSELALLQKNRFTYLLTTTRTSQVINSLKTALQVGR